jgi:hypothetical protein
MQVIFDRETKESLHFITLQRSRNYMNMKLSIEYETVNRTCALPVQTCKHDVIKYININCFTHPNHCVLTL